MIFVNLTPHEVNVVKTDGTIVSFPPSTVPARVGQTFIQFDTIDGIRMYVSKLDKVTALPKPEKNVIYIVSAMVKERESCRNDLVSPGNLIRDEKGRVIGCEGFII